MSRTAPLSRASGPRGDLEAVYRAWMSPENQTWRGAGETFPFHETETRLFADTDRCSSANSLELADPCRCTAGTVRTVSLGSPTSRTCGSIGSTRQAHSQPSRDMCSSSTSRSASPTCGRSCLRCPSPTGGCSTGSSTRTWAETAGGIVALRPSSKARSRRRGSSRRGRRRARRSRRGSSPGVPRRR